jgi:hypothetical protein
MSNYVSLFLQCQDNPPFAHLPTVSGGAEVPPPFATLESISQRAISILRIL